MSEYSAILTSIEQRIRYMSLKCSGGVAYAGPGACANSNNASIQTERVDSRQETEA
jgi:hypothetical protein